MGDRPTRSVADLPLASQTFLHANGNTLVSPSSGVPVPDRYDPENRWVERTNPDGSRVETVYAGDGMRVSKTVITATNTVTTYYLVDGINPTGYAQVLEDLISQDSSTPTLQAVCTCDHDLLSQD